MLATEQVQWAKDGLLANGKWELRHINLLLYPDGGAEVYIAATLMRQQIHAHRTYTGTGTQCVCVCAAVVCIGNSLHCNKCSCL